MQYVAICAKGLEDVTQLEIKELLGVESKVLIPGRVLFETDALGDFVKKVRSVIKVYTFLFQGKSWEAITPFPVESPFRVSCSRKGEHTFTSLQVEKEVGAKFCTDGATVDLKKPKTVVFVDIVGEDVFCGVDLTPVLLSKREYRIKVHNQSLNACVAYALARLADYGEGKVFLDPFLKDGVVAIEAALFAEGKIFAFDSMFPHLRNGEMNAKLAGVRKSINFSRTEVNWLDTKFKEGEVDCVVSALPFVSRNVPEKEVKKLYQELLHQLPFILKKSGKAVFIAPRLNLLKELNKKLQVIDERTVFVSGLEYTILVFSR